MRFAHVNPADVIRAGKVLNAEICYFDDKVADHISLDMIERLLLALESGGFAAAARLRISPLVIYNYRPSEFIAPYALECAIAECRCIRNFLESDATMKDLVDSYSFHDKGILDHFIRRMNDEAREYIRRRDGDAMMRAWNMLIGEAC